MARRAGERVLLRFYPGKVTYSQIHSLSKNVSELQIRKRWEYVQTSKLTTRLVLQGHTGYRKSPLPNNWSRPVRAVLQREHMMQAKTSCETHKQQEGKQRAQLQLSISPAGEAASPLGRQSSALRGSSGKKKVSCEMQVLKLPNKHLMLGSSGFI